MPKYQDEESDPEDFDEMEYQTILHAIQYIQCKFLFLYLLY